MTSPASGPSAPAPEPATPAARPPLYGPYRCTVDAWHDGDTAHVTLDLGFGLLLSLSCRCYGINAPELSSGGPGAAATDFARQLIPEGSQVWVASHGWDKYGGRFLGELHLPDQTLFGPKMIAAGHAKPYFGVGPK